jgi:hypothetical protein
VIAGDRVQFLEEPVEVVGGRCTSVS